MIKKPLHDILCEILGNNNCYFEPPVSIQMKFPCITYSYTNNLSMFADNVRYTKFKRYTVTIIDKNPDSKIQKKLEELPYCEFDRRFVFDGLTHFVYTLYYNGLRIKEE